MYEAQLASQMCGTVEEQTNLKPLKMAMLFNSEVENQCCDCDIPPDHVVARFPTYSC